MSRTTSQSKTRSQKTIYETLLLAWISLSDTASAVFLWWCHQMETFSALQAICAGNSRVTGEFPAQRPVMRNCDVFFDLPLNERKFETPSRPLWRHYVPFFLEAWELSDEHQHIANCTNNLLFAFITPADERGCYTWRGLIAHTSETTLQSGWHFTFCVCTTSLLHFKHIEVGKNGRHFTDDIFNCISLKENFQILNKITLKYIP